MKFLIPYVKRPVQPQIYSTFLVVIGAMKETKPGVWVSVGDYLFEEHRTPQALPLPRPIEYADMEVECQVCHARFSWRELEYDDHEDPDNAYSTNSKCPVCGAWDCCELELENLPDV